MAEQAQSEPQQEIQPEVKKQSTGWRKRLLHLLMALCGVAGLVAGVWQWRLRHQQQPASWHTTLFQGVTYIRDVRHSPRPLVIHVITVDLDAPGIGFVVTPGDPKIHWPQFPVRARRTTEFLHEFQAQVAINGDFFYPYFSHAPFSYYPHSGDPVDVQGFAASRGVIYCTNLTKRRFPCLFLSQDNRARIGEPDGPIYNAISGMRMVLQNGAFQAMQASYDNNLDGRAGVGLDRTRRKLILLLVDGRQPNFSEGVSFREMAAIFTQYGADTAMNFDEGGSETLAAEDRNGQPQLLNSTIDCYLPGRERPVANHLGILARPVP